MKDIVIRVGNRSQYERGVPDHRGDDRGASRAEAYDAESDGCFCHGYLRMQWMVLLFSEDVGFISGQMIVVNGGREVVRP
jgi:hypothetical protein